MPAPQLTPDQLQQAIAAWQGSNAPPAQSAPVPMPAVAPPAVAPPPVQAAPVAVDVPAPVVAPAPVPVEAPSPTVDVAPAPAPTPQNSRQALAQMGEQANIQASAIQDESAAKVAANTAEADLIAQQQAEEAKAQAVEAKAHAEGIAKTKNLFDQYQELRAQNRNLQAKDSRTTTQRVMGMLGKAFGSVADGLSGFSGHQTNFAGDIEKSINDSVDKDIAQQQAAIEGKHKEEAERLTDLGLARKFFLDDPDAAAAYAKAQRNEMYAKTVAELSKRSANPVIQAQGAQASANVLQKATQDMAQIYASKENAVYAASAANSRVQATNPETPYERMTQPQLQAIKDAGQLPAAGQKVLNNLVTGDNVQGANARNPEVIAQTKGAKLSEDQTVRDPKIAVQYAASADKFQNGINTVRTMTGLIDQIKADRKLFDMAERAKDVAGMSEVGARLESNGKLLTLNGKNAYELGALSGPDVGLINSVTGNVKSLTSGADTQLDTMGANITKSANQTAYSRGLEHPFQTAASATPAGKGKIQIVAGGKAVKAEIAPDVPAGRISVIKPDGSVGTIPADKLDLALSRGYKKAE